MNELLARAIIFEDQDDDIMETAEYFKEITQPKIYDRSRWSVYYSQVFQDTRDKRYWEINWGTGATEMQDGQDEDISFNEVTPKEVTTIKYVPIKKAK